MIIFRKFLISEKEGGSGEGEGVVWSFYCGNIVDKSTGSTSLCHSSSRLQ